MPTVSGVKGKISSTSLIPASLAKEFQTYFGNRRSVTDGLEVLIHKFLNLTLPDWTKNRVAEFEKISNHLKPFWPELWTLAWDSMTQEEFEREQVALLRSLEYDVSLYYTRHYAISSSKIRAVVTQVGDTSDKRASREAELAAFIRRDRQKRAMKRKIATTIAIRKSRETNQEATQARQELDRIRGEIQGLVSNGKIAPSDIPVINDTEVITAIANPVMSRAFSATLNRFPSTNEGNRQAFVSLFGSLTEFMENSEFQERFSDRQYRDYWFSALRDFREGVSTHKTKVKV